MRDFIFVNPYSRTVQGDMRHVHADLHGSRALAGA